MAQKKSKSSNLESDISMEKQSLSRKAEKLEQKIKKLKMELDKKTSSEEKKVISKKDDKKKKVISKKEDKKKKVISKKEDKKKKVISKKEDKKKKVTTKKEDKKKKVTTKKEDKEKKVTTKKEDKEKKVTTKKEDKEKKEETKKEEKKTYEEELEEQLTDEEIANFQIEKMDMEKLTNKVCDIVAKYETNGMLQSELWKKLKLTSRDGSRLALKLERLGIISREKILEKGRWTYKLIIKKTPVSTESIEEAPCLTCPVEQRCSLEGEISPRTCQLIEDWVLIEISKSKKKSK